MTDGCGFMNFAAFVVIANLMQQGRVCVVVQGRLLGSKGTWLLHPNPKHRDVNEKPKIWIRSSQRKVKYHSLAAVPRSHRILDLVRMPRLTTPSSINRQTITNLSSNGVPDEAIIKLFKDALYAEIEPLTTWTGENARTHLGKAIENAGKLISSRRSRQAGLEARAYTYISDEKDTDGIEDAAIKRTGLIERIPESGYPIGLHETCRELLQAGFTPLRLPILQDKLKKVIELVVASYIDQFHVSVPNSVESFIVPGWFIQL